MNDFFKTLLFLLGLSFSALGSPVQVFELDCTFISFPEKLLPHTVSNADFSKPATLFAEGKGSSDEISERALRLFKEGKGTLLGV